MNDLAPSFGEIQQALLSPGDAFTEPTLRKACIDPRAASGGNAACFVARTPTVKRTAVVTYHETPSARAKERFSRLTKYLAKNPVPFFPPFVFLPNGLWVKSRWEKGGRYIPVTVMGFAPGVCLDEWIEQHLGDELALEALSNVFRIAHRELIRRGIAHRDLHPGNLLIAPGPRLTFVDFGPIFVAGELEHLTNAEIGIPAYQHPDLSKNQKPHYARNADSFSALVIYVSILALRADRSLWKTFHRPVESNLIFTEHDFKNPGATPLWEKLRVSRDRRVSALASRLSNFCQTPVELLPLDSLADPTIHSRPRLAFKRATERVGEWVRTFREKRA